MSEALESIKHAALGEVAAASDSRTLEQIRVAYLGKKGQVTALLKQLGSMEPATRKAFGEQVNTAKQAVSDAIEKRSRELAASELAEQLAGESIDVTLDGRGVAPGGLHPLTRTLQRIERLFNEIGFETMDGPEIEDDFHNFGALNIPDWHPARAMQDTFYAGQGKHVLRTHTSPVQIRTMKAVVESGRTPPIRIVCPGRVYRVDSDRTHSPMFHQVEGLYVAKDVRFTDLKYDLQTFLSRFFEEEVEALFRPSYFPFVEPGADVHMRWKDPAKGPDHPGQWLELLGCGMVHPNVFKAVGLDPEQWSGYAFGMGVERLTMLRYGVNDLRQFFTNDARFLSQFA